MNTKNGNVIDIAKSRGFRPKSGKGSTVGDSQKENGEREMPDAKNPVVDMTERRHEQIQRDRRQVKRSLLTEFIGAFVVVPQRGLMKVALYDISENGLAFDIKSELGKFSLGEELAMRVYLNRQTYFPFFIRVRNVRQESDENVFRHGADFVKGAVNELALGHFVKFIETVSASLERDNGDVMVSNLRE